jgi:hypothetical protein
MACAGHVLWELTATSFPNYFSFSLFKTFSFVLLFYFLHVLHLMLLVRQRTFGQILLFKKRLSGTT